MSTFWIVVASVYAYLMIGIASARWIYKAEMEEGCAGPWLDCGCPHPHGTPQHEARKWAWVALIGWPLIWGSLLIVAACEGIAPACKRAVRFVERWAFGVKS